MLQFKVFIYHVFAQELTCYFVGVYMIIKIIYFFMCLVYCFFRDATGMVLHRDSKWYQQWQEFKDNNPVVTGKVIAFTTLLFSHVPAMVTTDKRQFCKKIFVACLHPT